MMTCGAPYYFWQHADFGNEEGGAHTSIMWLVFFPHLSVQQRNWSAFCCPLTLRECITCGKHCVNFRYCGIAVQQRFVVEKYEMHLILWVFAGDKKVFHC